MPFKQLTPLDMTQLEVLNLVLHNVAGAPSSPKPGQVWYDTSTGRFMFRAASTSIDPLDRANHTNTQLASTISNFDTQVRTSRLDQMAAPTAAVSANSQKITNLATPTTTGDAANKQYCDAITTSIPTYRLDQFAAPTAAVSMGSQRLINLGAPVSANDAIRLTDLQSYQNGVSWKTAVRVATTANLNISSPGATIDGVTMAAADRVLVKANTAGAENGIYVWNGAAVPMTRAIDGAQGTLLSGSIVPVLEGTANADTAWRLNTDGTITVGTTAQSWGPFANPFNPVAGSGISIVASTISADATIVRKFSQTIGDGVSTSYPVTHNLGTLDVTIGVFDVATGAEVGCEKVRTSTNISTIVVAVALTSGQLRVVIHG
jgi:hypothetical protein